MSISNRNEIKNFGSVISVEIVLLQVQWRKLENAVSFLRSTVSKRLFRAGS